MARPKKTHAQKKEERVSMATNLLGRLYTKGQVVAQLKERFRFSARSAENIITAAKSRIRTATEKTTTELVSEAFDYYRQILQDPQTEQREKIRAREALDKLLGIQGKINFGAAGGMSAEQQSELITNIVTDLLQFLASLDPSIRSLIAVKQMEIAEFIDMKYGARAEPTTS